MWTLYIIDQTAYSVQSDLDQHRPQILIVSSIARKELSFYVAEKETFRKH